LIVYADSSFIASVYAQESHSVEADRRMASRPRVFLTPLNRSELAHAFAFQVFRSRISETGAQTLWRQFERDCQTELWLSVDLPLSAWETSIDLARLHGPTLGIRTLDSLHVACALELNAERFWTFDARQERLAQAVGLNTGD
jgi:predicted nucleic acid-binding protein